MSERCGPDGMRKQEGHKGTKGIKERKKMRDEGMGELRVTCQQIAAYFNP